MPFGLDFKSFVIGALFVWFALPFVMNLFNKATSKSQAA